MTPDLVSAHTVVEVDARSLASFDKIVDASVSLVVTSPPYPMISMWDGVFSAMNPEIGEFLKSGRSADAFEAMHRELDKVWRGLCRICGPGAYVCVNIGDAVRTLDGRFRLWSNHARIEAALEKLGFDILPRIIWRKSTNSPTKFMGSGMLPAGAYVTLEHEYILIFRKTGKREHPGAEGRMKRRKSAFFWEERNLWFSDLWELGGERQKIESPVDEAADRRGSGKRPGAGIVSAAPDEDGTAFAELADQGRERSAAFPFELPFRLIAMYSLAGDLVLDPFAGTGTTSLAAMALGRSSLSLEVDAGLVSKTKARLEASLGDLQARVRRRYEEHLRFLSSGEGWETSKNTNADLACPVKSRQETDLTLFYPRSLSFRKKPDRGFEAEVAYEAFKPEA